MSERTEEMLRQAVDSQRRHIAEGTRNGETQIGHIEMLADAYLDVLDVVAELKAENATLRESVSELLQAMRDYVMENDGDPTSEHRAMTQRAVNALDGSTAGKAKR